MFHPTSLAPHTAQTLRHSATKPDDHAILHGPSFRSDGKQALYDLAAGYEKLIADPP
jgi:hypothetical protein